MRRWIERHAGAVFGAVVVVTITTLTLLINLVDRRLEAASPALRVTYSYAVALVDGLSSRQVLELAKLCDGISWRTKGATHDVA